MIARLYPQHVDARRYPVEEEEEHIRSGSPMKLLLIYVRESVENLPYVEVWF